jgi:DNA-binding XRE family transcriptional regulator
MEAMILYEKLKKLRLKKGITQEEMAIKLGYKYTSGYNQLEKGKRKIYIETARKIALILKEPVEEIFF